MYPQPQTINCSIKGRIGIITLCRPEKLNALNLEMFQSIDHHLTLWEKSPEVDMVVIQSTGEQAFSAGGDLRFIHSMATEHAGAEAHEKFDAFFQFEYGLNARIKNYKKPYIALIHGIAMGGGLGVSLHGSCRIVSENVTMAMPECAVGFFPDVICSAFLRECPGEIGKFLAVTGYRMNTADALYTGLATHYMPRDTFDVFLEALCKAPTEGCAEEVLHELLDYFAGGEVPVLSELEQRRDLIDDCFSQDTLEEALAELSLKKDPWVWKIVDMVEGSSPLSLKVAFELMRVARGVSFEELYATDLILAYHFLRTGDFIEGIRAKIIDKDNDPNWQFKTLEEVPQAMLEDYFERG